MSSISSAKQKLVIIGNGMAPGRALEQLFQRAPDAFDVTIFNAEPRVNYDRIMLSPLLSGEKSFDDIVIHGDGWYVRNGVTLYKGARVSSINRTTRTVTSQQGIVAAYDKLIIATGSMPIVLPIPGILLPGVLTYRDLDDVQAMILAAQSRGSAVVIGGGLLGLEAAAGLAERGMSVTVVHLMPTLMERQLDAAAGALLRLELESRGIRIVTGATTTSILGAERVEGVALADGEIIKAGLVIMAVGIRPNAALAKEAGLTVNRGIVVDSAMRTSDSDIFALGECAEADGQVYGLVAPLYEMANVVAAHLAGDATATFTATAAATKLKVTGINLFSAGDFSDGPDRENAILEDPASKTYKRLVLCDSRVIGTVMYGDTTDGAYVFDLIRSRRVISAMRDTLIFGASYDRADEPNEPTTAPLSLGTASELRAA
jgi:nitrite reductase (NADH) large subunit